MSSRPSQIVRSFMPVVAAAVAFISISEGASGDFLLPDEAGAGMARANAVTPSHVNPTTRPTPHEPVRTIHRLTNNQARDANPYIFGGKIYWERFGGAQGDTEVFSFNIASGAQTRETNNTFNDHLQAAGVWISTPVMPSLPFWHPRPVFSELIANINANNNKAEIYRDGVRITHNEMYEKSVKVSDNPRHGMVWLGAELPETVPGTGPSLNIFPSQGFDVFWSNGSRSRNQKITRLTDSPEATSVAFGGPWAAWTTVSNNEVVLHHVRTGETRSFNALNPGNLDVSGSYVKYETPRFGFQSRVMVYDIESDTTITVGDDPGPGFHSDSQSVLSDQYVAYKRSFSNPFITPILLNPFPTPITPIRPDFPLGDLSVILFPFPFPHQTPELRLFDLDTLTDILVTEGEGISGLQIDGTTLVWQMQDPNAGNWDLEIFTYDTISGILRQVTDNDVDDMAPQISGDNIVWTTRMADGQTEIYYETSINEAVFGHYPNDPETNPSGQAVAAVIPEPGSAALISVAGVLTLGRRRSRRRALA